MNEQLVFPHTHVNSCVELTHTLRACLCVSVCLGRVLALCRGLFWLVGNAEPPAVWGLEGQPSGPLHYLTLHMSRQAGSEIPLLTPQTELSLQCRCFCRFVVSRIRICSLCLCFCGDEPRHPPESSSRPTVSASHRRPDSGRPTPICLCCLRLT